MAKIKTEPKAYYATKKRVEDYIVRKLDLFENKTEFIKEVDLAIVDLLDCNGRLANRNQIRFFHAVKKALENLVD